MSQYITGQPCDTLEIGHSAGFSQLQAGGSYVGALQLQNRIRRHTLVQKEDSRSCCLRAAWFILGTANPGRYHMTPVIFLAQSSCVKSFLEPADLPNWSSSQNMIGHSNRQILSPTEKHQSCQNILDCGILATKSDRIRCDTIVTPNDTLAHPWDPWWSVFLWYSHSIQLQLH